MRAQQAEALEPGVAEPEFLCPMDKEVRSKTPGRCPRCGMALVAGLPPAVEYPVELRVTPRRVRAGEPVELRFRVLEPKTRRPVAKLLVMHEKLFHLFLISQDLSYFAHEHPEMQADGSLVFRTVLPAAGTYRLVCDFYPEGGVPQMVTKTVLVPGGRMAAPRLAAERGPRQAEGVEFRLVTEPEEPVAGRRTLLFFSFGGLRRLEQYLGFVGAHVGGVGGSAGPGAFASGDCRGRAGDAVQRDFSAGGGVSGMGADSGRGTGADGAV